MYGSILASSISARTRARSMPAAAASFSICSGDRPSITFSATQRRQPCDSVFSPVITFLPPLARQRFGSSPPLPDTPPTSHDPLPGDPLPPLPDDPLLPL